jgi:hypothetical protein
MAHRPQEGDTYKPSGANGGAVFFRGKWRHFSCLLCLREHVAPATVRIVQPSKRAAEVADHAPRSFGCLGPDAHRRALGMKP